MKILHIIRDEKFIDTAFERFEKAAPGKNTFLLASYKKQKKYKFLKKTTPVINCRPTDLFLNSFVDWLASYDLIVLHSLYAFSIEVVNKVKNRTTIVWIGWGYDYYDLIYKNNDLYEKYTREFLCKSNLIEENKKSIKEFLIWLIEYFVYKSKKTDVLEYIDYFAPVLECEYTLVFERNKGFHPKYFDWNYGTATNIVAKSDSADRIKSNILIGNSGSPNNNHLDAFRLLENLKIPSEAKIIVPLSYSGSTHYINEVVRYGVKAFGEKFLPLLDFMPYNEYVKTIESCGFMIMNHKRQQGTGNIGLGLLNGVKVFCNPYNAYYTTSIKRGMCIYSTSDLDEKAISMPLTEIEKRENNIKMQAVLDEKWFDERTKRLVQLINVEVK